jgi:hypothetical protein
MISVPDFPEQRAMTLLQDLKQQLSLLIAERQRNGSYAHDAPPYNIPYASVIALDIVCTDSP